MPLFDATAQPTEFRDVTLHVISVKIVGSFVTDVKNTGRLPLFSTALTMSNCKAEGVLFCPKASVNLGNMARNSKITIKWQWAVSGVLNVLWQLIRAFLTGTIKAEGTFNITARGFSKTFTTKVVVPAKNIKTSWWT